MESLWNPGWLLCIRLQLFNKHIFLPWFPDLQVEKTPFFSLIRMENANAPTSKKHDRTSSQSSPKKKLKLTPEEKKEEKRYEKMLKHWKGVDFYQSKQPTRISNHGIKGKSSIANLSESELIQTILEFDKIINHLVLNSLVTMVTITICSFDQYV